VGEQVPGVRCRVSGARDWVLGAGAIVNYEFYRGVPAEHLLTGCSEELFQSHLG
jgi:hypothetical protein